MLYRIHQLTTSPSRRQLVIAEGALLMQVAGPSLNLLPSIPRILQAWLFNIWRWLECLCPALSSVIISRAGAFVACSGVGNNSTDQLIVRDVEFKYLQYIIISLVCQGYCLLYRNVYILTYPHVSWSGLHCSCKTYRKVRPVEWISSSKGNCQHNVISQSST